MKQCVSDWNPADYEDEPDWWTNMTEEEKTAYEDEVTASMLESKLEMDRLEGELCKKLGVNCLSEVSPVRMNRDEMIHMTRGDD